MDRDYKNNHLKMMERARKIKNTSKLILPPIHTIINRIDSSNRKYQYNRNSEYNYSYGSSISKEAESLIQ